VFGQSSDDLLRFAAAMPSYHGFRAVGFAFLLATAW